MRTIAIPAALHEVFGAEQTMGSLIGVLLAGAAGAGAFFLLGSDTLIAAGIPRSAIALLLAFDIAAGCAANFTRGTSDFYARSAAKRRIFIAVHLHLPALALLAGLPLLPSLAAWALSIAAASIVNGRAGKLDQAATAGLLLALSLAALFLIPMPEAQRFISSLFYIKLAYAFAVDHYGAGASAAQGGGA
jgi:hypothetical protein